MDCKSLRIFFAQKICNLSKTYFLTIFFNSYATRPLFLNIFSIFALLMVFFLNRTTPLY